MLQIITQMKGGNCVKIEMKRLARCYQIVPYGINIVSYKWNYSYSICFLLHCSQNMQTVELQRIQMIISFCEIAYSALMKMFLFLRFNESDRLEKKCLSNSYRIPMTQS